jgi:putative peptidoglycan lipid II flippase
MSATTIIDQTMAAWLPSGSVSALGMGTKLSALVMSVGALALSTTLLPHLSALAAREDWTALRSIMQRVTLVILGLTVPLTVALIVWSAPIVGALYQRGAFTAADTQLVAQVQSAYLLQLPVHLLGILYVRLISALGANRLLTISAAISLSINVVLNLIFMQWIGVAGIALSTAAVYLMSCTFLGLSAHRSLLRARRAAMQRDRVDAERDGPDSRRVPCASAA